MFEPVPYEHHAGVVVKKLRSSSSGLGPSLDPDFPDLFNVDDLLAPQCPVGGVEPIIDTLSFGSAMWPPSLRFSFESVFQNEIAAASQFGPPCSSPILSTFEESTPPSIGFAADDSSVLVMDCSDDHRLHDSSSDATSTHSSGLESLMKMEESGAYDVALRTLQQLVESEQEWEERLHELYRSYKPGDEVGETLALVKREMNSELQDIDALLDTSVLPVQDLYMALSLKDRCANVLQKCQVLKNEELYNERSHQVEPQELISLVWETQPLARSFKNKNRARATFKKKKGHCSLHAQLVKAPGVKFRATSSVTAYFYLNLDEPSIGAWGKKKTKKSTAPARNRQSTKRTAEDALAPKDQRTDVQIQNNVANLEDDRVSFNFRFPAGTRNKPCSIRLHVRGVIETSDGAQCEVDVVSEPTHRFIVTTNECQYEGAELKLMAMEMYPHAGQDTCSWARFVNALNVRWMRVTRQESESSVALVNVDRTLTVEDMDYITRHFFDELPKRVAYAELVSFYDFFGKVTHVYRHNGAMRQLLLQGLVWGFLSKQGASELLGKLQAGSFVIRASDSEPGSFVISWNDGESVEVRHALLESKVVSSNNVGVIADFIASKPFLQFVCTPVIQGRSIVQRPSLRHKDDAFGMFYVQAKRSAPSTRPRPIITDGYVDI